MCSGLESASAGVATLSVVEAMLAIMAAVPTIKAAMLADLATRLKSW
jgi:hypothetical protein